MSEERFSLFDHTPLPGATGLDGGSFDSQASVLDVAPVNPDVETKPFSFPTEPKARLNAVLETLRVEYAVLPFESPKVKALIDISDFISADIDSSSDNKIGASLVFDRIRVEAKYNQEYGIAIRRLLKLKDIAVEDVEQGDEDLVVTELADEEEAEDEYDYGYRDDRLAAFKDKLEALLVELFYPEADAVNVPPTV